MDNFRRFRWIILVLLSIVSIFLIRNIFIIQKSGFFSPVFTSGFNILLNSLTFAFFCLTLILGVVSGRAKMSVFARKSLILAIWVLLVAVIGTVCSRYLKPSGFENAIVLASDILVILLLIFVYFKRRNRYAEMIASNSIRKSAEGAGKIRYAFSLLYGSILVQTVVLIVYFILTYHKANDLFIMAPLAGILLSMVLWYVVKWRGFLLLGYMWTLLCAGVYLYGTLMSYHFSALGEILAFTLLYLSSLVPLGDLYCRREEAI